MFKSKKIGHTVQLKPQTWTQNLVVDCLDYFGIKDDII